jgi:hypothetical protein
MRPIVVFLLTIPALFGVATSSAQPQNLAALQDNITLFRGVLEDALDLGPGDGLFAMNRGGVESTYIAGQGVVFEVRSALAARRNQLNLAALSTTMQSLQPPGNPFDAFRRNADAAPAAEASITSDPALETDSFYQQMMDRIADVDYSLVVNTAIQQAANAMRSLRSLGDLDEQEYALRRAELDAMRDAIAARLEELRALEQRARQSVADATSEQTRAALRSQLDDLLAQIEPLREQAMSQARELQARMSDAEQRYVEQWEADVVAFEDKVYIAFCDFGASLRLLPDGESIAVVLDNLGAESADNRPTDRVHVLASAGIQACIRGEIDAATLRERSLAYSD